jgi:hypothetical protein
MPSKKNYRGGSGSGPSAWSYVYNTVGSGYDQFKNALTLQPGQNLGSIQSNDIEPRVNLNAQNTEGMPTKTDLSLIQKAGSRKRRRGGNFGAIANQALAPLSLLALQQTYGKRKSKGRKGKGGNMGAIANQALAPLSLLALQQTYGKRKSKGRKGKGGNMGAIANQALAPLSLLALQQGYANRKGSRSRKNKGNSKRRTRRSRR